MNNTDTVPETTGESNLLSQLGNIFVAPGQALDYARSKPGSWWLPLIILIMFSTAFSLWWALTANLNAYHLAQMQMFTHLHPGHASQYGQYIMHQGRGSLFFYVVMSSVTIVIIELLYALYLFLADKVFSADSKSYGQWFAFSAWTAMPLVLATIASMAAFSLSDKTGLSPPDATSLNNLLFHLKPIDRLYRLTQFSVFQFWMIGLVVYGLKRWCRHGTGKAVIIALLPYIVVYGTIFLI